MGYERFLLSLGGLVPGVAWGMSASCLHGSFIAISSLGGCNENSLARGSALGLELGVPGVVTPDPLNHS